MTATECPNRQQLLDYTTGRIGDTAAERLSEHLERCASCENTVAQLDHASDTYIDALADAPEDESYGEEPQMAKMLARIGVIEEWGAAVDTEPLQSHPAVPASLRDYRLLGKLGEGGMGTVYRALHTRMNRVVALKMLPAHRVGHEPSVARFAREIEAASRLDHPNIVAAYDAGESEQMHFLVMELVEGIDLHRLVKQLGPLPVSDACELVRQAAEGLQHAHEHGLVHRDMKPSNIVLTQDGDVKVLDLGLALLGDDQQQRDELTGTGQVMGTLDYMAPEQADNSHGVDQRADIYALGCTLYKLLTGEVPFAGADYDSPLKKMAAHAKSEPPSVQQRRDDLPDELATLVRSLLAKEPTQRPETAAEVAQALTFFATGSDLRALAGRVEGLPDRETRAASAAEIPVLLQSSTRAARGYLWPAVAALVLCVILGGVAAAVIIKIRRGNDELAELTVPAGTEVEVDEQGNPTVILPAENQLGLAGRQDVRQAAPGGLQPTWKWPSTKPSARSALRVDHYGDPLPGGAVVRLGTTRFRHGRPIQSLVYSPDGNVLASCSHRKTIFWDARTGRPLSHIEDTESAGAPPDQVAFSTEGNLVLLAGRRTRVWDLNSGQDIFSRPVKGYAAMAANGRFLVTGDLVVYNVVSGKETGRLGDPARPMGARVVISPDGRFLAEISTQLIAQKGIRVWDLAADKIALKIEISDKQTDVANMAHFSPGSETLLVLERRMADRSWHTQVRKWEIESGTVSDLLTTDAYVYALAYSPDGKTIATAGGRGRLQLWDAVTGQSRGVLLGYENHPAAVTFSPDGRMLALAGTGGVIHRWDVTTGVKYHQDQTHQQVIGTLDVSPDGRLAATGSDDATVRVWDMQTGDHLQKLKSHNYDIHHLRFSPDGQFLATGAADDSLCLWGIDSRRPPGPAFLKHRFPTNNVWPSNIGFSQDGSRVFAVGGHGATRVWDTAAGEVKGKYGFGSHTDSAAFSPDGRLVAVVDHGAGFDSAPKLFLGNLATGEQLAAIPFAGGSFREPEIKGPPPPATRIEITNDGAHLVWGSGASIVIFHVAERKVVGTIDVPQRFFVHGFYPPVRFSRDNHLLAAVVGSAYENEQTVRVWEFTSGQPLASVVTTGGVQGIAFSRNPRFLVTGGNDTSALVWDLASLIGNIPQDSGVDLAAAWERLRSHDVARAYQAAWSMIDAGPRAVEYLARLKPATNPSPAEEKTPFVTSDDVLRELRAIMVLEQIAAKEARDVLETIAAGAPSDRKTIAAKSALERMSPSIRAGKQGKSR